MYMYLCYVVSPFDGEIAQDVVLKVAIVIGFDLFVTLTIVLLCLRGFTSLIKLNLLAFTFTTTPNNVYLYTYTHIIVVRRETLHKLITLA